MVWHTMNSAIGSVISAVSYRHSVKYLASDVPRRTLLIMVYQVTPGSSADPALSAAAVQYRRRYHFIIIQVMSWPNKTINMFFATSRGKEIYAISHYY